MLKQSGIQIAHACLCANIERLEFNFTIVLLEANLPLLILDYKQLGVMTEALIVYSVTLKQIKKQSFLME